MVGLKEGMYISLDVDAAIYTGKTMGMGMGDGEWGGCLGGTG